MSTSFFEDVYRVQARALLKAGARIKELEGKLESLYVQAVPSIVDGWVGIPTVEWDAIMAPDSIPLLQGCSTKDGK